MLKLTSFRKSTCREIEGLMTAGCHGAAWQLVVQSSCAWGLAALCPAHCWDVGLGQDASFGNPGAFGVYH